MKNWKKIIGGFLAAGMFALSGCGGGGGGATPGQSVISGTASQGAPLAAGSTVYLKDAKGVEKATAIAGDNGSYRIVVDGLTAPFVLKAGNYYSFSTVPGTVNINPFTKLCMENALVTTDLAGFYGEGSKPPAPESLSTLGTKFQPIVDDLKLKINALYGSSVPATQRDFLNGSIIIGLGVDKIFENIDIVSDASSFTINRKGQASPLVSGTRDQAAGTVAVTKDDNAITAFSSILYPKVTVTITPSGDLSYTVKGTQMDGVAAMTLDIVYDAASLASPTVTQGTLVAGALLEANTLIPGHIRIGIISTSAFSGSGQIATITFASKTGSGGITSISADMFDSNGSPVASSSGN